MQQSDDHFVLGTQSSTVRVAVRPVVYDYVTMSSARSMSRVPLWMVYEGKLQRMELDVQIRQHRQAREALD